MRSAGGRGLPRRGTDLAVRDTGRSTAAEHHYSVRERLQYASFGNHGTVSWGPTLELAYFNTEIIDAYCRILLLAKQLGRVNYFTEEHTSELMAFKKRIGYDDPRIHINDCELCGPSVFDDGYGDFVPESHAFQLEAQSPMIY